MGFRVILNFRKFKVALNPTNKKRAGINTFVCTVSLYVAETTKASIMDHEPSLPITPFGIVEYGFVGQPFSKQLYLLACEQAPSEEGKKYSVSAEIKKLVSEAIGAGSLFAGYKFAGG